MGDADEKHAGEEPPAADPPDGAPRPQPPCASAAPVPFGWVLALLPFDAAPLAPLLAKLPTDSERFARYCLIGVLNTGIHYSILVALSELLDKVLFPLRKALPATLCALVEFFHADWLVFGSIPFGPHHWATSVGFLSANLFSYYANSRWNFGAKRTVGRYARFLPASLAGLALSNAVMSVVEALGLHYLFALLFQPLVALIGFTLLRMFVFPKTRESHR